MQVDQVFVVKVIQEDLVLHQLSMDLVVEVEQVLQEQMVLAQQQVQEEMV